MSGIFAPVAIAVLAFLLAFITYRDIRRGGARFYTLEREAILRRASFTLMASVLLFLGAIGLLLYQRQQQVEEIAVQAGAEIEGVPTATATLSTLPPTITPTATPDPDLPTPTATPIVCRAIVEGTGASGLNLRETPGGAELQVIQEGEIVTLITEEPPVQQGGISWIKVRTALTRTEGWAARDFLVIEVEECLSLLQP